MIHTIPPRRSRRAQRPNKKYTSNKLETLSILSSDSEPEADIVQEHEDITKDEDFTADGANEGFISADEDEVSGCEGSDDSGIATPFEDYEDATSYASSNDTPEIADYAESTEPHSFVSVASSHPRKNRDQSLHSRGIPEASRHGSKEHILKCHFGAGTKDLIYFVRSRDKWAVDLTLPTRGPNKYNSGGMGYPFSHTEEKRRMESTQGWNWYYEHGGRMFFQEKQKLRAIASDESTQYMPRFTKKSQMFLAGPYGRQRAFNLPISQSLSLNESWESVSATNDDDTGVTRKGSKKGWTMNVGARVRCLDWASNHKNPQYLAIAVFPSASQISVKSAPAFTPSPLLATSIQIWSFGGSISSGVEDLLYPTQSPELRLVVCTKWGDVKQFKWCPLTRTSRDVNSRGKIFVGLMAGIWGDGHIRVLDIEVDPEGIAPTKYVEIEDAAFHAQAPNTICTCLTWLSATDIAVGCANGFVAVWNISKAPTTQTSCVSVSSSQSSLTEPIPAPWFYHCIHQTCILAMVSAYPSYPHLLATSAMDGYLRLTDVRSPTADFVLSSRCRIAPCVLAYCDPLSAVISADDNDFIRVLPLRRFFHSTSFARVGAPILGLSVGRFHPIVLIASADGTLVATNPMRKVLNQKAQQYQQTVLRHEWTRKGEGMSRVTEGYKVETAKLQRTLTADPKAKDGIVFATIHEDKTAVTHVVWNPNLCCGGWMAAGMGSGLVRVEDLAV